jgi:hypothetical protein
MASSRSFVDVPLHPKKKRSDSISKTPPHHITSTSPKIVSPIISHKTSDDSEESSEEDFVVLNTKVVRF